MLPVHILIDATLKSLTERGVFYTILQRGEQSSGTILLKVFDQKNTCKLLTQQRNLDGELEWMNAMDQDTPAEPDADAYIVRTKARDPDMWIIEVEDPAMINPFEV